jgi:hypothetical protein
MPLNFKDNFKTQRFFKCTLHHIYILCLEVMVAGMVVEGALRDESLAAEVADEGLLHVLVERVHPGPLLRGRRKGALKPGVIT